MRPHSDAEMQPAVGAQRRRRRGLGQGFQPLAALRRLHVQLLVVQVPRCQHDSPPERLAARNSAHARRAAGRGRRRRRGHRAMGAVGPFQERPRARPRRDKVSNEIMRDY